MGFIGGADKTHGFLRVFFLVVAILIFLISGVVVFSDTLAPWLPELQNRLAIRFRRGCTLRKSLGQ